MKHFKDYSSLVGTVCTGLWLSATVGCEYFAYTGVEKNPRLRQMGWKYDEEEKERWTPKLWSESDPLVFWVLAHSAALWATESGRSTVYRRPSGNYFSVCMDDWNYQRAGGKSTCWTPLLILMPPRKREIYSHFCLPRRSNPRCHTSVTARFRPLTVWLPR